MCVSDVSVCIYVSLCTHSHIYTHSHTCMRAYMKYMSKDYVFIYICVRGYGCTCSYMYVRMRVWVYMREYACLSGMQDVWVEDNG